jgi:hypothetical protein
MATEEPMSQSRPAALPALALNLARNWAMLAALLWSGSAAAITPPAEDSLLNPVGGKPLAISLDAELGFLAPIANTIQFDHDGTKFDYIEDGGQEILFPFLRLQTSLDVGKRETFVFLYQPLDLQTEVVLDQDVTEDTVTFPANSTLNLRYGFSFWRGTWLHELLPAPEKELAIGLGLQLRNADISFESGDGTVRFSERDVGPVPLFAARTRFPVGKRGFFGAEASGSYAPIKYLNGANVDVVGALLDASVKGGFTLRHGADVYACVRYIGGGAEGTSKNPDGLGDGYTANWLSFTSLSLGAQLR